MNECIIQKRIISLSEEEVNRILTDWLVRNELLEENNKSKITYEYNFSVSNNNEYSEDMYFGCNIIIESSIKV